MFHIFGGKPYIEITDWMPAKAPTEHPFFAIGDVHGRLDLLTLLHDEIRQIAKCDRLKNGTVIHLGDYVDRGPESLKCLQTCLDGLGIPGFSDVTLPGNHEQMMVHFLTGPQPARALDLWMGNGGSKVAAEIGWETTGMNGIFRHMNRFRRALENAIGEEHLAKLLSLKNHHRIGKWLFVHAGLHPDIGLAMLNDPWDEVRFGDEDGDPLWIRGPFYFHHGSFENGVIVVHGHTIRDEPWIGHSRIGIDTGAYSLGRLTALEVRDDKMRFIQAVGRAMR